MPGVGKQVEENKGYKGEGDMGHGSTELFIEKRENIFKTYTHYPIPFYLLPSSTHFD